MDTSVWCPGNAKVGVRIGTNSDTKFGVLGTLTVFTVHGGIAVFQEHCKWGLLSVSTSSFLMMFEFSTLFRPKKSRSSLQ